MIPIMAEIEILIKNTITTEETNRLTTREINSTYAKVITHQGITRNSPRLQ